MRTGHTKMRCNPTVFPKMFICRLRLDWHSPGHKRGKCRTAASPKLFTFREAGTQVSPVTMSCPFPRTTAPPYLPLAIKDSLKENMRLFALGAFALGFLPEAFAFGFWAFDFLI
jgi:hypothetical protein